MTSLTLIKKWVKKCPWDGYFFSATSLIKDLDRDFNKTVRRMRFFKSRTTRQFYNDLLDQVFLELFLRRRFELQNRLERAMEKRLTQFDRIFKR